MSSCILASLVPSCTLFTAVLPKQLYKTPTSYIHYHLQDKTHRSHPGLIKRARQNSFPPHPFAFPVVSSLAFAASFLPPVFISILLNFLSYARDKYLVCNLDFIGCHVFDIRSVTYIFKVSILCTFSLLLAGIS